MRGKSNLTGITSAGGEMETMTTLYQWGHVCEPVRSRMPRSCILQILLSIALLASVQIPVRATGVSDPALAVSIEAVLNEKALQPGIQGIDVVSFLNGEALFARNEDKVFMPASNNKILTSCAALAVLGSDFRFITRVKSTSRVKGGVLLGDLVLIGSGDPILSTADLDSLARQIASSGIKRIKGTIRYDDRLFDSQRLGDSWAWDDEAAYYSAQISALNCDENTVEILCRPGSKIGAAVRVQISARTSTIRVMNTATTSAYGTIGSLSIDRLRGSNTIPVSGLIPLSNTAQGKAAQSGNANLRHSMYAPVAVTIDNPSLFTAELFAQSLLKAGIKLAVTTPLPVPIDVERTGLRQPVMIAEHRSAPLSELLVKLNKPSDNLIAECLMKTIGTVKKKQGTSGTEGTGELAARDFFRTLTLDLDQLQQADGSGLSRRNFVSPHNIVRLLSAMRRRPDFNFFYNSLPIAGVDGTLRNRMKESAAQNNCHAKTGYISHASALSGYVTTGDGEMLAFSILMNNHLCSNSICVAAQDKIVALLASYKRPRDYK